MADEETKNESPEQVEGVEETVETPAEETAEETVEEVKEEAPKAEEKAEEAPKAEKAEPTGKFADMIKQIEEMKVADLADLVKALEERFGVSAAMPMAVAGAGAAGAEAAEEKTSYTVMLKDSGAQKIAVIKAVREINQELGLKEAKDLVDAAPKEIKKDIPKADAEEAKKKLEAAGASVELI
jgi:large subunit ribosomal protein L7/L12